MDCDRTFAKKFKYFTEFSTRENRTEGEIDMFPQASAPKIMLVDDEQVVLSFVKRVLKSHRFTVECFGNPVKALQCFQESPYQYDLVITDQTMPEMLGSEMTAQMLETRPEMPVILSSGYSDLIDESNVHEFGIRYFLAKPIILDGLLKAVDDCLTPQPSNV